MGGGRRPPTRGRPREPETQADTQDNTQPPAQPPAPPRTSPAWLAAHFENVARRPQPTSERSGYETVRVVAARDADAENQGGELKISDGRHTCRVLVPPTVDAGQPLESTVGTLLRLHGARVVVDRTHAPPRRSPPCPPRPPRPPAAALPARAPAGGRQRARTSGSSSASPRCP